MRNFYLYIQITIKTDLDVVICGVLQRHIYSKNYVEESMKEQEMSVQEVAELASCLNTPAYELRELIGEFKG